MKTVYITSSANDNYVNYLLALIASVVENTKNTNIEFNLIYENLSEENIKKIASIFQDKLKLNFIKIDKNILKNVVLESYYKVSYEAYTRILIPSLLFNLDKTIYLDPDIIVLKDLNDLYETNIENHEIAAVKDYNPNSINLFREVFEIQNAQSYFNSGVMVMNLKKLRECNFTSKAVDLIKNSKKKYKFFDQDILNYFFCNSFLKLDPRWNTQLYLELNTSNYQHSSLTEEEYKNCQKEPFIVHYTIVKPDKLNYFFKFKNIYKKYLESTGEKFIIKKTSFKDFFWILVEMVFFKLINILNLKTRNLILDSTRSRVIKVVFSNKKH